MGLLFTLIPLFDNYILKLIMLVVILLVNMHAINTLQTDLLYVIDGMEGATVHEIKRELNNYYPEILHARIYSKLNDLAAQGLVEKTEEGDKRANAHSLTEKGVEELAAQRDWELGYADW